MNTDVCTEEHEGIYSVIVITLCTGLSNRSVYPCHCVQYMSVVVFVGSYSESEVVFSLRVMSL